MLYKRAITIFKLGTLNLAFVLIYRLLLRSGLAKKRMPTGTPIRTAFLSPFNGQFDKEHSEAEAEAEAMLLGRMKFFSNAHYRVGNPPNWFLNPVSNWVMPSENLHWSMVSDCDTDAGDIKLIWEASRFDWTLVFARAYKSSGDNKYFDACNQWLSDWSEKNPQNVGPNWRCGQEVSIRMMQLLLSAFILEQASPSDALVDFVVQHCERIAPTLLYAIAQDNNHGTSEAAALFIGGAWLINHSEKGSTIAEKAKEWHRRGLFWLENRASKLIEEDGSFSQYSVNYHRVMLDTISIVEFWRKVLNLPAFSHQYYQKAQAATLWLYGMTDSLSGDAPNMGANDGARIFVLSNSEYRDYRPSVQLASWMFWERRAYGKGSWDEPLYWLDQHEHINSDKYLHSISSKVFRDGGYSLLVSKTTSEHSKAVVKFPRYRFRPGQADALHMDLWCKGKNILRDAGSYSYLTDEPWLSYFSSTAAHNTIEFDNRSQMPKVSRFLYADWLKTRDVSEIKQEDERTVWECAYKDAQGCYHRRSVENIGRKWVITDDVHGFVSNAVLRWRLIPGKWSQSGNQYDSKYATIEIQSDISAIRNELVKGWESLFYSQKSEAPIIEYELDQPAKIITVICLK